MKKHNIDVRLMSSTSKVTKHSNKLAVHLDNGEIIESESCLLALGRSPNTTGLNLKEVGIKIEPNGGVLVDEYSNSSAPGVYAIGDSINNI